MRLKAVLATVLATLTAWPAAAVEVPTLQSLLWVARPIIVFADSPADPRVAQQLKFLQDRDEELAARDVQIFVDTDPAAQGAFRQTFRPRGFSVILVGKDGEVKYRKPAPVPADEFTRLIERMPLRRRELLNSGESVRP